MNRIAIITAFLGGVKNRYMQYKPEIGIAEKIQLAKKIPGVAGFELCYPQDFEDLSLLKKLLADNGFGVAAVNVRSRANGKWLRGSFTSVDPAERRSIVQEFHKAMDACSELGVKRITTCPLNDGHDYVFEANYFDSYRYAEESFAAICEKDRSIKVCIEYKQNDPRTRCLLASAGETIAFCSAVGAPNLGATLDIGHSILAGERPAQAVALLSRAEKLFYVHLNDNDRHWDWDMPPGIFNFWEFIEFFHYLTRAGYTDDWYAYDVMSKEMDTVRTFDFVVRSTRKMEELAARLDPATMQAKTATADPLAGLNYLWDTVLR